MTSSFVWILVLAVSVSSIKQYDFNACRISNCNSEEQNCISEEQGCLNTFSTMRSWYSSFYLVWQAAQEINSITILVGPNAKILLRGPILIGSVCHFATKTYAI